MARTTNISVSLPIDLIDAVRRYARRRRIAVSAAVQESLENLFRREQEAAVERDIAAYFADPAIRREEDRLTEIWMKASSLRGEEHARSTVPARRRVCR